MPVDDDLWTCRRCGAVVAQLGRHQDWHDKLEGKHEPDETSEGGEAWVPRDRRLRSR
ncbi:hypothetical protein [Cellulosimicrobium funkei]|uniref:hypothetical protein n=1 Tax=Cellulosimicrobium funkei TaxID=264251 RepID=UPI0037DCDEAF